MQTNCVILPEPIGAHHKILIEMSEKLACGLGEQIVGGQKIRSLLLREIAHRNMNHHFIPVEIRPESRTSKRAKLNHIARRRRQENRMKGLEAVSVQRGLPVEQHHEI